MGSTRDVHERAIVAVLARRRLRRRWRSVLGVAVLVAVTTGVGMFAIAGARRTQSAYPRMLREVDVSTMSMSTYLNFGVTSDEAVASFPEVVRSGTMFGFNLVGLDGDGRPDQSMAWESVGTFDGRYFDQDRFTPTSGRSSDPTAIHEVVVNEYGARLLDLSVGQQLDVATYTTEQVLDTSFYDDPPAPHSTMTATIVGVGLFPDEVLQDDADRTARLLLTPAYSERHRELATYGLQGLILEHGDEDVPAVKRRAATVVPPGTVDFRVTSVDTFHAQQAIRPLTIALGLFGVIVAAAGLFMAGQAANRLARLERGDHRALRSMGIARRALAVADGLLPLVAIVAGTALGALLAIAASPLTPVGPVRRIEVSPGIDVDWPVVVVSMACVLVVLGASVAIDVWRGARPDPPRAAAGIPTWRSAATGVVSTPGAAALHLTFGQDRRGGVTARSVVAGAVTGVAALVVALTFGASLDLLVGRPDLYGWNWNAAVVAANGYGNLDAKLADSLLADDADIVAWSGAWFGSDLVDGREIPLLGVPPGSRVLPPVIAGRPIAGPDEIVLGSASAAQLGVQVGDSVVLGDGDRTTPLDVVGLATFPAIGPVHLARTSLGVGAMVAPDLVPGSDLDLTASERGDFGPNVIFVRFRSDADPDAATARLRELIAPLRGFAGLDVLGVQRPAEIVNSSSVGRAPLALAGALLLGALVSLALSIGTFVRRRRNDLAVLRALGFTRRQLIATVSWQAVLLVSPGVLVGVPLGVILGRMLWSDFAERMNAIAASSVPVLSVVAVVVAAYLVALAAAAVHARNAARIDPARLLRAE